MTTESITLLQAMTTKMGWLEKNQQVIAQNIANADTPGYQPEELKKIDFKDILRGSTSRLSLGDDAHVGVKRTNAGHIGINGTMGLDGSPKHQTQKNTYETAPAGNAVVLEEQLLTMNKNTTDHQLITNLYQKNIDMLNMAIKGN